MANTYLTHTTSTPTNNDICTISFWIKFSNVGSDLGVFSQHTDSNNRIQLARLASGALSLFQKVSSSIEISITTNRLFRDVSAWYHVVIAFDTTQSTASDRVKFYVNGVQETSFSVSTYPSQNTDIRFNSSSLSQEIGRITADTYMDGYMSHVAFVDGQALAPTVFGLTDSTSGIWKFKPPSGVTWGTNGFWLKFENSGNLGLDSSGNSNTFTVNGNGRQALDTPSNVYATLNPLIINNFLASTIIYAATTEGNNTLTGTSATNNGNGWSTLGASSGKWYCELKVTLKDGGYPYIGVAPEDMLTVQGGNYGVPGFQYTDTVSYNVDGTVRINSSTSGFGDTYGLNDIIGIAMDLNNGAVYFSKNGTWQNSGDPTSGASKTGAGLTFTANDKYYFFGASVFKTTNQVKFNFGNGYFGTTAITSAGSNGNGSLFEYDVPSGYYALNTKNINTYG